MVEIKKIKKATDFHCGCHERVGSNCWKAVELIEKVVRHGICKSTCPHCAFETVEYGVPTIDDVKKDLEFLGIPVRIVKQTNPEVVIEKTIVHKIIEKLSELYESNAEKILESLLLIALADKSLSDIKLDFNNLSHRIRTSEIIAPDSLLKSLADDLGIGKDEDNQNKKEIEMLNDYIVTHKSKFVMITFNDDTTITGVIIGAAEKDGNCLLIENEIGKFPINIKLIKKIEEI